MNISDKTTTDPMQSDKRNPRLLVLAGASVSNLLSPLARRLKADRNYDTVLLAANKNLLPGPKFFDFDAHDFRKIVLFGNRHLPTAEKDLPSFATLTDQVRRLEARTGVKVLDAIRSDRMIGIGFVTSAHFLGNYFAANITYRQMVDLAIRMHIFAEELLQEHEPLAIVGYPGSILYSPLINIAESRGIRMISLWPPRRDNHYTWITDRFGWIEGLAEEFEREYAMLLRTSKYEVLETEQNHLDTPERAKIHLDALRTKTTILPLLRKIYRQLRVELPKHIRGQRFDYGNYILTDKLSVILKGWLKDRRALRQDWVLPTLEPDMPFIFVPLTTEPEAALMVESQRADDQTAIINWLAKTIPAGWHLVVKEHPLQPTPRMKGFFERIRRYPNVIMAAALEPSDAFVQRAKAVALIHGTVGLQCALGGKPVIIYHRHFIARVLPHVMYADSYDTTEAAVSRIVEDDLPTMRERYLAGKAFDRVWERHGFPITNDNMLAGHAGKGGISENDLKGLFEKFYASLDKASVAKRPLAVTTSEDTAMQNIAD
jgi:hypothetical protein